MKNLLLKLILLLCLFTSAFAQVTISGTQEVATGQTHTITLTANQTVTGISVVGSGTTLVINGSFTLTNSDSTNGTVLNGGRINGTGTLTTSFIDVSGAGTLGIVGLTITGTQVDTLLFNSVANTVTLSGGGSGDINLGGGDDTVIVSSIYTGNLVGGGSSETNTLRLDGGTVSGTLDTFQVLDVTSGGGVLNSNLSVGSATLAGALTGTGNLTVTGNTTAGAGQINISGDLTLQGQTSDLTLGNNVTTVNLTAGSHTEGNITLGSGATNATINISSASQQTFTGNLTGSGDDNLSLSGVFLSGTITGFDSLSVGGANSSTINTNLGSAGNRLSFTTNAVSSTLISNNISVYFSSVSINRDLTSLGSGSVLDIDGVISGSNSTSRELNVATIILRSGTSGSIYFGNVVNDVIFDGRSSLNALVFATASNITLRNGATYLPTSSSGNIGNFTVSGTGVNILGTSLGTFFTGSITISGTLRINLSVVLSPVSGQTNQVTSGGTLDVSQVGNNSVFINRSPLTILGGGTLAVGTSKNRNASNITLTRGADSSTSSVVSIDLGRRATGSSTPIFSTLPALTGTGTVALNITGSLINESTQVFASGDVTAAYRTSGAFELSFNGTNTLIEFTGIGGVDLVGVTGATSRVLKVQTALAQLQEEASLISVAGLALLDRISLLEPVAVARELSQLIPTQAVSVATSGVTTTATTTNSIIATRTISVATGKSTGAKGPDQESKLAGVNIWADFGLSFGGLDSDDQSRGYDFSSYATRFGIDKRYSKTVLGLAFGYTTTSLENDGIAGDNDLTTLSFSFYGSYTGNEKYRIDLQTSLATNDIKVSGVNSGSTDGTLFDIDTTVHYTALKDFTPFVGLRLIFNDFASYTLRGALPINVEGESYNSFYLTFGTRWDRGWKTKTYRHNVGLKASCHYNLLDTQRDTTAVFVGGTESFEVRGVEEDKSSIIFGVDYALRRAKLTYLFSYDLAFGSSSSSHRLSLKANYRF